MIDPCTYSDYNARSKGSWAGKQGWIYLEIINLSTRGLNDTLESCIKKDERGEEQIKKAFFYLVRRSEKKKRYRYCLVSFHQIGHGGRKK